MSRDDFIVEIFFPSQRVRSKSPSLPACPPARLHSLNDVFNSRSLREWCFKNLNQVTFNFNNNFVNEKNLISSLCRTREVDFASVYIINQFIKTVEKEFNRSSNQTNFIFRSLNSLSENEDIFSESLCELRSHVSRDVITHNIKNARIVY